MELAKEKITQPRLWKTIFHSAPVRIIGGFLFVGIAIVLSTAIAWALHTLGGSSPLAWIWKVPLGSLVTVGATLSAYLLFVRWTEGRRQPAELSTRGAPRELASGLALGAAMFSLTTLLLWMGGAYHISGIIADPWKGLFGDFLLALVSASIEEILFRGLLFRLSEQAWGSRWALLISAACFGLAHMLNPHANWWAGIAITMEAGIFLAAAYMTTRRLWFPIGAHFGWNFIQGGILSGAIPGLEGSGIGLLHGKLTGPDWLTGGAFGVETSVCAVGVCLVVSAFLLWRICRKDKKFPANF